MTRPGWRRCSSAARSCSTAGSRPSSSGSGTTSPTRSGRRACCATGPSDIEAVHRAYFEAGADVAITASYQATYEGFAAAGIGAAETTRLLRLSVELARRARDAVRPDGLVAASVGPYAVVLADGAEYTGDYGGVSAERIAAVHRPRDRGAARGRAGPARARDDPVDRRGRRAGRAARRSSPASRRG